ncbi:MAG TPA: response regulator transcription factor [Acidimicrobiales bacterium]|nr:response regulator transcription factor [Acidimicrobiales bacterium]
MTSDTTVFLADDAPDMRMLLTAVLEHAGFTVVDEAVDGTEALAKVAELSPPPVPTVMVLDNRMPGATGLEVAERVLATYPHQRIVLFTAYLDAEVASAARAVGIRECVSKADWKTLPAVVADLAAAS